MVKKAVVPDAWDDDWEAQADRAAQEEPQQQPEPQAPLSRAERIVQHTETNRRLWESAESPETLHFVEANSNVPLSSNFKPQVKVLSRKPLIAKRDPVTGMSQLSVDDDADDDPTKREPQLTPEEIRAKQLKEREERQRRYDEARAKIFGESAPSSGTSSPGAVTPPRSEGRHTPQGGRGRGRGGGGNRNNDVRQTEGRRLNPSSSGRELYDPSYSSKSALGGQSRSGDAELPSRVGTPKERQAIRAPRGPDGSGRGGFGFARRGDKDA